MRPGVWSISYLLLLAALLTCGISVAAEAPVPAGAPVTGLAVEPGGLLLQDVGPGELYDLAAKTGILLTIHNRDRNDHTYVISSHRPSEVGNRRVPPGYSDIGDPSWLWFEQPEVRVPAQGSSRVRMFLRIPDDERYRNQHWSVSVAVVGKPEPGETLTLAVYPRFEIETAAVAKSGLRLKPAGEVAVCPSVVTLDALAKQARLRGEFVLCNNDRKTHRYRLTVLAQEEAAQRVRFSPSGGFTWLPESSWVSVRRPHLWADPRWSFADWPAVWLARQSYLAIPVELRVPNSVQAPEGGWEALLLVEREDGATAFARVQVLAAEPEGGKATP